MRDESLLWRLSLNLCVLCMPQSTQHPLPSRPESLQAYFTNYLDAHTLSVTWAIIIGCSTVQFQFQFQLLTRRTGSKFYCTRIKSALTKAWGSTFNIYFKCTYMYFKCKCNIYLKTFTQLVFIWMTFTFAKELFQHVIAFTQIWVFVVFTVWVTVRH